MHSTHPSTIASTIRSGEFTTKDLGSIAVHMYSVVDTVHMLECGAMVGIEMQYWDTALQVRERMMHQLSEACFAEDDAWDRFNPVLARCLSNAFGQLSAAIRVMQEHRNNPCTCVPAVMFLKARMYAPRLPDMRHEERVLRLALSRLHGNSRDLAIMVKHHTHAWVHWMAVSHMLVEVLRSQGDDDPLPQTMRPFASSIRTLRAKFRELVEDAKACQTMGEGQSKKQKCIRGGTVMRMSLSEFMSTYEDLAALAEGAADVEETIALACSRQHNFEVQGLYAGGDNRRGFAQRTSHGHEMLVSIFQMLTPNTTLPRFSSTEKRKECLACARTTRLLAKAIYLVSIASYASMVAYVIPCVHHMLD